MSERKVFGPRSVTGAVGRSASDSGSSRRGVASDSGSAKSRSRSPSAVDEDKKSSSSRRSLSSRDASDGKKDKKRSDIDGAKPKKDADGKKAKPQTHGSIEGTPYAALPKLKDVPPEEQSDVFCQKVEQCIVVYDFRFEVSLADKEGKRQTLVELVDYVYSSKGRAGVDEKVMRSVAEMVAANTFRTLTKRERTPIDMLDGDDDDPPLDPAWPHLELVYELLLRIVSSKDLDANVAAKCIDQNFLQKMLDVFDSDDPRERDVLKTIVNRIYAKVSALRSFVRKAVQNLCIKASQENEVQNGVAELLEILSRIINGFATPLKEENRELLHKVLVPLHKVDWLCMFHSQLLDCTKKLTEKEPRLAHDVVAALLRYWPFSISSKQILFLNEIEDLIHVMPGAEFKRVQERLGQRLALCVSYPNSDVAEKALVLWKNERFLKLIMGQCRDQLPVIISALYDNATQHWQNNVHSRTFEVLKLLMERDPELFDAASSRHRKDVEERERRELERERRWAALQAMHDNKLAAAAANGAAKDRQGSAQAAPMSGVLSGESVMAQAQTAAPSTIPFNSKPRSSAGPGDGPERKGVPGTPRPTPEEDRKLTEDSAGPNEQSRSPRQNNAALVGAKSVALPNTRYGVSVSWDEAAVEVDVVLQALLVDTRGRVVGATHGSNRVAMQVLVHCIDDRPMLEVVRTNCSGILWMNFARASEQVALIVLLVCSRSGGRLCDLAGCAVHVVEDAKNMEVLSFPLEKPKGDAGVVGVVKRGGGEEQAWSFSKADEFGKTGRHFMDVLEVSVGKAIREALPAVPKRQKVAITFSPLETGAVVCLPSAVQAKWLFVGLSWDISPSLPGAEGLGLNASLVYFDSQGQSLGACCADNTEAYGARHSGRGGLLGQGLMLDLQQAPVDTTQIFVLGHLVKERLASMEGLQRAHCCVVDPFGTELLRYPLMRHKQSQKDRGFIAGRFLRFEDSRGASRNGSPTNAGLAAANGANGANGANVGAAGGRGSAANGAAAGSRWAFQALAIPCSGDRWEDSLEDLRGPFAAPAEAFQPLPSDLPAAGHCVVSL